MTEKETRLKQVMEIRRSIHDTHIAFNDSESEAIYYLGASAGYDAGYGAAEMAKGKEKVDNLQ